MDDHPAPKRLATTRHPTSAGLPGSNGVDAHAHAAARIAHRIQMLESALQHIEPTPQTAVIRQATELELMQLKALPKQREVRSALEGHARDILHERTREAQFQAQDDNGESTLLFDPAKFNARPTFFEEERKQASVPTFFDEERKQASASAASNVAAAASPATPAPSTSFYPLSDQSVPPLPHSATFTTTHSVPSLKKQLPPPVVPKVEAPPTAAVTTPTKAFGRLASVNNLKRSGAPASAASASLQSNALNQQQHQLFQQSLQNPNSMLSSLFGSMTQSTFSPLPQSHLSQLNAMNQTSQQQQSSVLQMQQQQSHQQHVAMVMKFYEDQQRALLNGMHPNMSASILNAQRNYTTQRMQRQYLESRRTAYTQEDRQKKKLRKFFLGELKTHAGKFAAFHKERRKTLKALANSAAKIEADLERKRQTEEGRQARVRIREAEQRLAALKANDLEAYAKLIKDCKSQRIQLLLQQTAMWEHKLKSMMREKKSAGEKEERLAREKLLREEQKAKLEQDGDTEMKDEPAAAAAAAASSTAAASSSAAADSSDVQVNLDDNSLLDLEAEEQVTQPLIMTGGELKEYQIAGIQWLVKLYNNHLNGILADEMGLGKTIMTIGLFAYLMESKHVPGPFLIIAPLSTQKNWISEFAKWCPLIRVVPYGGSKDVRTMLWKTSLKPGSYNVVLTSFEYIMNKHDRGKLGNVQWKYIAVDEGHRLKNANSMLATTLADRYHSPHRLILSGTPLQNDLRELWALLNFLLPTIFDSSESFEEWFSKPFENQGLGGAAKGSDAAEELLDEEEKLLIIHRLHTILRPFLLRRLKSQVASQLPPKKEIIVKSTLTCWQKLIYEQLLSHTGVQSVDALGQVKTKRMMNTYMQLRKIVNHPYVFEQSNPDFQAGMTAGPDLIRSSGKFDLLHRMIPKLIRNGHRVLLFSQMTKILDLIEDYCLWKEIKFVRLDGSSSSEARSNAQDAFNREGSDIHLFIMSTRAGGLGLNLQQADTVIIFDSDWNPQADVQAMDRAHRLGQCWGQGTRLMLADGSSKKVEHIKLSDQLMGDDGTPRRVLGLIQGHTAEDEKATDATPRRPPLKKEFLRDDGTPRVFAGNAPRPLTAKSEYFCQYEGCDATFATDKRSTLTSHETRHPWVTPPMPGMYRITPSVGGLDSWTCNGSHVLVLRWNHRPSVVKFVHETEQTGTISRPWQFWAFEQRGNLVVMGFHLFATQQEAEQAQATATANFQPLEVEMPVDDFLSCADYVRESAVMFQPSGPVQFDAPDFTLQQHLERTLGDAVSPELLAETAWVLGAYLASGVGDEIAVPSGERAAVFKDLFRRWRDSNIMPYTGDESAPSTPGQQNWFARFRRDSVECEAASTSSSSSSAAASSAPAVSCSQEEGKSTPTTPYDDDVVMDQDSDSVSLVGKNWCDAGVPYQTFAALVKGRSAQLPTIDIRHIGVDPSSKSDCAVVYCWCVEVLDFVAYFQWLATVIADEEDGTAERRIRRCMAVAKYAQKQGGRFCYYFGESTTAQTRYTVGRLSTTAHVLHASTLHPSFRFHFRVLAAQDNVLNARHNKRASLRMEGEVGALIGITEESLGTHVLNAAPLGVRYGCSVSDEVMATGELLSLLVEHLDLDNEDAAIPRALLAESLPVRQALAAGILDTRGHIRTVSKQAIELNHSSEVHLQTVCHLLRGLGCDVGAVHQASDSSRGYTMLVNLGAHLSALPTRLPGRSIPLPRANALKPYAAFCFGFKVEKVAHARYYGLELDGNRRCLMHDFTVTHNSSEVRVFRLISLSPVEEAVLTRAQNKLKIDQMVIQSGKFDEGRGQKTTSEERKTLLQDILRTDVKLGDAVAPTDAEINRMMCRSEEEYERFQAMDEEITREDARVWKELKNTPCPGRLITEDELPIHVRHVDLTAILDEEENLDTSKRAARAVTSYADALSDREWARCLDQGIDPNVYAKKKQDRKAAAAAAASSSSNGRDRQGRKSRPIVVEDDEEGLKSDDDDQLQDDVSEDTGVASDIESSSSSASEEEAASAVSGSESDVSFDGRGKKRRASAAASSSQPSSAAKRGRASTSSKKTPAKGRGAPARSRSARKWQSYDSDAEEASRDDSEPMIVDASAASSASKRNNPKRKTSQVESTPDEETPTEGRASRSRGAAGSRASRLSASPSPSPSPSPAPAASPLTPALSRRAYMAQKRNSDAAAAAASASQERATSSPTSNAAAEEAPTSSSSAAKRRKR